MTVTEATLNIQDSKRGRNGSKPPYALKARSKEKISKNVYKRHKSILNMVMNKTPSSKLLSIPKLCSVCPLVAGAKHPCITQYNI